MDRTLYTTRGLPNCLFRPLSSSLFEKTSHYVPFLKRSTGKSVDFIGQRSASANPSCDVTIFVKRAQNAQLPFRMFLKISDTLKVHISG